VVIFSDDDSPSLIREAERLNVASYLLKAHLLPSRLSSTVADLLRNRESPRRTGSEAVQQAS